MEGDFSRLSQLFNQLKDADCAGLTNRNNSILTYERISSWSSSTNMAALFVKSTQVLNSYQRQLSNLSVKSSFLFKNSIMTAYLECITLFQTLLKVHFEFKRNSFSITFLYQVTVLIHVLKFQYIYSIHFTLIFVDCHLDKTLFRDNRTGTWEVT